jgi:glycosyltransferase involved in cell wall biosynthesis
VLAFGLEGPPVGVAAPGRFVAVGTRGLTRGARERELARRSLAAAREAGCALTVGVRHLPEVDLLWLHGGTHAGTLRALGKAPRGRHRDFLELERAALAGGARRVVAVSELVRREVLELAPDAAGRTVVIPNGVDLERFRIAARPAARAALLAAAGWEEGPPVLSFVARQAELKGLPRLLEALARVEREPWRLVVAGPRDADRWRRRARHLGGSERVLVVPELDPVVLASGADLCVLPSRRDPCPLVVLEALAAGTPVLVSDAVGAAEALARPGDGEVVPVGVSPSDLARRLEDRLEALRVAPPDREAVAACVAERGRGAWLAALERALLELLPPAP